jgi:hypothetical protein
MSGPPSAAAAAAAGTNPTDVSSPGLFQNVRRFFSKLVGGLFAEEAKHPLPVHLSVSIICLASPFPTFFMRSLFQLQLFCKARMTHQWACPPRVLFFFTPACHG